MRKTGGLFLALWIPWMVSGQFAVNGSAQNLNGDCVQITPAANGQQGAAWHDDQLDVSLPFCIHLTVNLGGNDGGADGIAFVLHQLGPNQPTTTTGGNVGYGNFDAGTNSFIDATFDPSIVIEFDTWNNPNFGDPFYDHVALQRDGTNNHNGPDCLAGPLEASATDFNIEDGQDHTVHIEWDPGSQSLRMEFDDIERFDATVDLENDVFAGNSMVWWGFTGSTGGANNNQSFCLLDLSNGADIPGLTLNPAPPYSVCEGETMDITASAPGLTVSWSGLNSPTLAAGPGNHVVQAADGGCPLSELITVDPLPGPNLATETEVVLCDGEAQVLTAVADPGTSLDWDGTGAATLLVDATGTHTVTANLGTCTETETVEVTVQAIPQLTISPTNDLTLCDGESQPVSATTDIPATISWFQNGSPIGGSEQLIATDGAWIVEAEVLGCQAVPVVVQCEILNLPTAEIASIPEVLCWNTTGLVYAVPAGGSNVQDWILPAGVNAPNQAVTGMYTALLVEDNGCTDQVSYFLNTLPPIDFELEGPNGACNGETVTLAVTGSTETVSWSTGESTPTIALESADGSGPFTVTVGQGGCSETAQTTVEWWPVPSVGPLADTVIRCVLEPPVEWTWPAQAEPPVGWWVWSVDGATVTGGPTWEAEGSYTVRILDSMTGCADSTEVHVNVWPNLELEAFPRNATVCWDETLEVLAELRAAEGTDIEELPYTLEWNDPAVEGLSPTVGAGIYLLEAENACGRVAAVVEVDQEYCGCDMWVPTAFTPDNDGVNDGFKVETNCPELDEYLFQVYDRWGELVWASADPGDAWMGQASSESWMAETHFVPDGIYSYRLWWKYSEVLVPFVEERRGIIHLLR